MNLFGFVDSRTFLTKSGDVGVVIEVRGIDYECLDPAQLDRVARRFEATLKVFDDRFCVYQYLQKRDNPALPAEGHADNPVLQRAVSTRLAHLKARAARLYSLDTYFVVLHQPRIDSGGIGEVLSATVNRPLAALRESFSTGRKADVLGTEIDRARETLANRVDTFLIQLRDIVEARVLVKRRGLCLPPPTPELLTSIRRPSPTQARRVPRLLSYAMKRWSVIAIISA